MEQEDLLELALDFFGLEENFTEEQLRTRYRELAKKYHPDSSEFTSNILFNELNRCKTVLDDYLNFRTHTKAGSIPYPKAGLNETKKKDLAYELYKAAKEIENRAILEYFEKTKGNPVFLDPKENPPLRDLAMALKIPMDNYKKILEEYPQSIWSKDAKDSLLRLVNWIRGGSEGG